MNTSDTINNLRDLFRSALIDWDVPVSVKYCDQDELYTVRFTLWGHTLEEEFAADSEQSWETLDDCPHRLTDLISVWQWVAMKLADKC